MPPQHKLHKKTGKSLMKKCPPTVPETATENSSEIECAEEVNQQFETELCWCIQQLQTGLKSLKLSTKQVNDYTKALNILMSNSAPVIKKRQVMRLSFGDYREKMAAESKRLGRATCKVKLSPATPSKKSVFIRRSAFTSSNGNTFRFNFNNENSEIYTATTADANKVLHEEDRNYKEMYNFTPSDNGFRFNFDNLLVSDETDQH